MRKTNFLLNFLFKNNKPSKPSNVHKIPSALIRERPSISRECLVLLLKCVVSCVPHGCSLNYLVGLSHGGILGFFKFVRKKN